jgi:TonB family protein
VVSGKGPFPGREGLSPGLGPVEGKGNGSGAAGYNSLVEGEGSGHGRHGWSGAGILLEVGKGSSGLGSGPGNGARDGKGGHGWSGSGGGSSGSTIPAPRVDRNPKPVYPLEARDKGYHGQVVLRVEVLSNGLVGQIEIKRSSGYAMLDQSASSAVKRWKFVPARQDGVPVTSWVNIPIKYELF